MKKELFNATGADMANSNSSWFDAGTNLSADNIRAQQKRLFLELKSLQEIHYRKSYASKDPEIYMRSRAAEIIDSTLQLLRSDKLNNKYDKMSPRNRSAIDYLSLAWRNDAGVERMVMLELQDAAMQEDTFAVLGFHLYSLVMESTTWSSLMQCTGMVFVMFEYAEGSSDHGGKVEVAEFVLIMVPLSTTA